MNWKIILIAAGIGYSPFAFSQEKVQPEFNKHELGLSAQFRYGRISPGIQYYYNIKPTQQLGANLNLFYRQSGNTTIISPELTLAYRWRKELFKGLYGYVSPLLSYSVMSFNDNFPIHTWAVGANAGLEYDFNRNKVPLILGMGIQTSLRYSTGRFGYDLSPKFSLRYTF